MSINAKLLASGLILGLIGGGFALMIDRSSNAVVEATDTVFRDGIDPLTRLEAASVRSEELAFRFMETGRSPDPNGIVSREETAELIDGLSKVLAELRAVSVQDRPISGQLSDLAYGLNRLRMTDGEITRRLLRRELSTLVGDFNRAIRTMREDVKVLRARSTDQAQEVQTFVIAGLATGFLVGALLLAYLSRSIGRSIRHAASSLRRASGADGDGAPEKSGDAIRELQTAIAFIEKAIESRSVEAGKEKTETARRFQGEMQREKKRFDAALNNIPQAFCLLDDHNALLVANNAFFALFPDIRIGMKVVGSGSDLLENLLREPHQEIESRELTDGRCFEVRRHTSAQIGGTIIIFEDVTQQRAASREMERLSGLDALTGLANRTSFYNRLDQLLRDDALAGELALLSIDVEEFNNVNATLGYSAGDDMLRQLAERLVGLTSEDDLVARLAGDEFGIIHMANGQPGAGERLARTIMDDVERRPVRVAGRPLTMSVAVGMVALRKMDRIAGLEAQDLMQECELALQEAKAQPERKFKVYRPELREEMQAKQRLATDLRTALERNEFELHFQPFVDLKRRAVSGFEALVRWRHPTRGQVGPAEFIPLMEEMGLIVPLGRWVLVEACRHATHWPANLSLSVNLSAVQVKSPDLVNVVRQALTQSGLAPGRLQLEVTESLFLDDAEGVLDTLVKLRKLGLVVSMDDFGTGYSSLGYLSRFPFDKIKIDQSFVRDMNRAENIAIVRAVMGLGSAMKMSVIAEGVETVDQLMQLEREGCVEVQGYLFSKPRPASDLAKMLVEVREGFAKGQFRQPGEAANLRVV